jgi:hypothetical protein
MPVSFLVAWYILSGLNIVLLRFVMRRLTHSRFRDDRGDITTEIGYEEDATGRDLNQQREDFSVNSLAEQAHFDITTNANTGPM